MPRVLDGLMRPDPSPLPPAAAGTPKSWHAPSSVRGCHKAGSAPSRPTIAIRLALPSRALVPTAWLEDERDVQRTHREGVGSCVVIAVSYTHLTLPTSDL